MCVYIYIYSNTQQIFSFEAASPGRDRHVPYYYCFCFDNIFFPPMPPHVLMNFRGFPPGCGDSVADF